MLLLQLLLLSFELLLTVELEGRLRRAPLAASADQCRAGSGPRTCRAREDASAAAARGPVVARAHEGAYGRISCFFEIARDRVAGMGVHSGSNVFLCSFYDIC